MEHDHIRDPVTGRCELCDSRKIRGYGYNFAEKRGSVGDLSGKRKFKSAAQSAEFVNRLVIDREPTTIEQPKREPTNLRPVSGYKRRGSATVDDSPNQQNGGIPGQNDIFITINNPENNQAPPDIREIPPTPAPRSPTPPTPPPVIYINQNKREPSPPPTPTPRRGSKAPQVIVVNLDEDRKVNKRPETPEPEYIYVQEEKPKPKPTIIRKKFEPPPTQEVIYVEDERKPQVQTLPPRLAQPRKSIVVVEQPKTKVVTQRPLTPNPKYPVTTLKLGNRVDPYTKTYGKLYSHSGRSHLDGRGRGRCLCCCITAFLVAAAIAGLIAGILYWKEMTTFKAQLPPKRYYWVVPDCPTAVGNETTPGCAVTKIVNADSSFTVPAYITTTTPAAASQLAPPTVSLMGYIIFSIILVLLQ